MKKLDRIRDFCDVWNEYDKEKFVNIHTWKRRFKEAGYFEICIDNNWACRLQHRYADSGYLSDMHSWCVENFGDFHYAWQGSSFWFETAEDAVLFKLRWI